MVVDNLARLHKLLDAFSSAEDRLVVSNAYLASIFDNAEEAILAKNLDGVITAWNPASEKLYGFGSEEAVGENISIIVPEEKLDELKAVMERVNKGELIKPFETLRKSKTGKLIPVIVTISPIKDRTGTVIGASAITHPKRAEVNYEQSR